MPELPEVETMKRGIAPVIGSRIESIELPRIKAKSISISPSFRVLKSRLVGRVISGTDRIGKRVVLILDNTDRLVFEPRMTGLVLITDPPTQDHLRFVMKLGSNQEVKAGGESFGRRLASSERQANAREENAEGNSLMYWDRRGLGLIRLLTNEEYEERFYGGKLGEDALKIGYESFRDAISRTRRPIKVALLDQGLVAGVGNLYASEILHVSRISPHALPSRLTEREWSELFAAMRLVLSEAIQYEGSTLSDGTYRNALNKEGGYQNHHRVYDREGERCPTCAKSDIVREVQAQRATFFCPVCQLDKANELGSKSKSRSSRNKKNSS